MLLRKDKEGVVAIPQPSHAWLSGQLARAWGNSDFAAPAPNEEVCIAAEQHDIGWLQWERRPALDPGTGLPQEFFRLQPKKHIALWREGVARACAFGRYPAHLFHAPRVALRAEGKRLTGCFSTQRELNSALAGARSVLVTAELRKA